MIIAVPNCHLSSLFKKDAGLSGGPVIRNLPANAGNMGSIPGPGRFHMLQVATEPKCAKTVELMHLQLRLHKRSHHNEKPMHHNKE